LSKKKRLAFVVRSLFAFAALAAGSWLAGPLVNAQQRFGTPSLALHPRGIIRVTAPGRHISQMSTAHSSRFTFRDHRRARGRIGCVGADIGLTAQQLLAPYPGYGFDFEYSNTINNDLGIEGSIDPATELRMREQEQWGCSEVLTPGYVLLEDIGSDDTVTNETALGSDESEQPTPQAQIIVLQEQSRPSEPPAQSGATMQSAAPPLPDEGEFELVLANGSHLEAVAFRREEDQVIYITDKGTRHSIALSDLDIATTIRVNEDHGTPLPLAF
jgi:hypothetical protein